MYIYVYICIYICVCIYNIYIYIYLKFLQKFRETTSQRKLVFWYALHSVLHYLFLTLTILHFHTIRKFI